MVPSAALMCPIGSFPRKRERRFAALAASVESGVPAFAGMTPWGGGQGGD